MPQTYPGTVRVDRAMYTAALFQYKGDSRLTVVGAGTKTVYQFNGRGSRVVVNGRDVASLASVPLLTRV